MAFIGVLTVFNCMIAVFFTFIFQFELLTFRIFKLPSKISKNLPKMTPRHPQSILDQPQIFLLLFSKFLDFFGYVHFDHCADFELCSRATLMCTWQSSRTSEFEQNASLKLS